ncbi:MAG TPA: zinc ABC transporter substrate-binding protein [Campylobacterales bacterium]|nr:zinc ABC transporter substrate-binding protein [Campylobacterales bacterium]
MIKLILVLLFSTTAIYAKVNVVVSILPQKSFVEAIGGDKVDITLMVKPGHSPHTYEPKPSQMKDIQSANLYFSIGIEFENVWLDKFAAGNKDMKIINISNNIEKMGKNPHIWTTPRNIKDIGENILNALILEDRQNKEYYADNYKKFLQNTIDTDKKIKEILKETPKKSRFMVFHPAWGYFAKEYDLVQVAVEVHGKNPNPKTIVKILKEAKKHGVKAILTAPEFSDSVSKMIANELKIKVLKISPLNPKWSENLIKLANAVAQ